MRIIYIMLNYLFAKASISKFLFIILLSLSYPAFPADLEEIVVTAQKVEETHQVEAVAQSSLSGLWIKDLYIDSFDALSFFVPGLYVEEQSINSAGYAIRGMTSDNSEATRTPRVSVWQHGMDISRPQGAYTAFYDIERIDVFKGPVGTLFGRGGQIGGVNIINQLARKENALSIEAGIGSFDEYKTSGFLNRQIGDSHAVRFAFLAHERDGFIENADGTDLHSVDTKAARFSYSGSFGVHDLVLQINHEQNRPHSPAFQSFDYPPDAPFSEGTSSNGDRLTIHRDIDDLYAKVTHPLPQNASASLSFQYRNVETDDTFDPDGTILDLVEANEQADFSTLEGKFEFSSVNEWNSTTFGVDFMREEVDVRFSAFINEQLAIRLPLVQQTPDLKTLMDLFGISIGNELFTDLGAPNPYTLLPLSSRRYEEQTESVDNSFYSVYFDSTFFLADKLRLITGFRYSMEDLETAIYTPPYDDGGENTVADINLFLLPEDDSLLHSSASGNYSGISGRLSMEYQLETDTGIYATYARGRRPDILNFTEQSVKEHLRDETVDSLETGFRSRSNDQSRKVDISAYYYQFRHFATQRSGVTALVVESDDDASAKVYGLESSFIQLLGKDFLIYSNLTFNQAFFDESDIVQGKNRFRYAPQWAGSISISKDVHTLFGGSGRITLQDSFQTEVFFEDDNEANGGRNRQGGYSLYHLHADFMLDKNFTIRFFVKNLTDKEYIIDAGNFGGLFGMPTFVPAIGRYGGLSIEYRN